MSNANEEPPKSADPKVFVKWKADDTKLFAITIAATVTANVVAVVIVALAILIARSTHLRPGATTGDWAFFWGESLFPLATLVMIVMFLRDNHRQAQAAIGEPGMKAINWTIIAIGVFSFFMTMIFVFSLVGLATGIK